ncbi:uncharacterized protein B0P05DRAFT_588510 [Gilbertella persicaria]|uniref:uncharacterized protein n=1 Tax=Gilbertella persicaria TaxID=101096 RepID=UPI00221ECD26|nr:uncharacterized protein B0P05DRAFT_588510 [Gilbertella persicaria]KAI8075478.1 hypothetical protein B0P05DRAFT_588510 [Gilbertella persicaria]
MGKSAKFYKRPSKKEKEGIVLKKLVEPSTISKKKEKTISIPADMFKPQKTENASEDIDMTENTSKPKKEKKEKQPELPDYVDLFSGKKTYKKIPGKRKQ